MKVKTSLCTFFIGIASTLSAQVTIDVNVNKPGVEVSPMLYGIFLKRLIMQEMAGCMPNYCVTALLKAIRIDFRIMPECAELCCR